MFITKISLAEQARNALLEEIVNGFLAAGTRLTEESISSRYQISRTPVRDALRRLEDDGLIERVSNRGYQVKKLDIAAVEELLSCRTTVELHIFTHDYANISMDSLRELHAELTALDPASPEALSIARRIDDKLHNAINESCSNRYWRNIHSKLLCQRLPYRDIRNNGDHALVMKLKNERLQLLAAILSGDAARGAEALRNHLEAGQRDVLAALQKNS